MVSKGLSLLITEFNLTGELQKLSLRCVNLRNFVHHNFISCVLRKVYYA